MSKLTSANHRDSTRMPRRTERLRRYWPIVAALVVLLFGALEQSSGQESATDVKKRNQAKETTILPSDIPIQMNAERLQFSQATNTYTAWGNISVSQGNTRLRADSIQYKANTGELTAKGGVIVRMGGDVVEAEKVTIKLSTGTGVVYNGKLLLTKNNIYLEGKKLEKVGESTYKIEKGSFTTCDGAIPDWRITGEDLDVTLEGYGTLKHGFFYIKDIPVFYVPWLIYPAKRMRQTGFLMPSMANSSLRGVDVQFPFFLNISRGMDATIVPRICTRMAAQAALEFRYFPYEDIRGNFYGEYTYDWRYAPETNPKNHRFYCTFRHDQDLAPYVRLKANGSWVSDRDYFEFWGGRVDKRVRVRYLESNAVLYGQSNDLLFQAEARYVDNLDLPDNALTVQNIPIVKGTLFSRQIPYTPFYLNSNLTFDRFFSPFMNHRWLGSRMQTNTSLSLPIALGRYLKLEPSITYFAKAYVADYYERNKSVSSVTAVRTDLYQVHADMFTDLNAVYPGSLLGFQRIRHTVRPRFSWTYRPINSKEIFPYFDEEDRVSSISLLTAEMRHTLTGRLGPGEYLDIMTLSISQGYDFDNPRYTDQRQKATGHPSPYNWTTTQAELTVKPHSLVDLAAQAEYDPVKNRARRYSVNLGLMDHRGDVVRLLHQFTEDENQEDLNRQTNVNLQVKVTSALDCFFENQYTHQFNFSYFTSFGLSYHPACWSILLRYSEIREQDPITQKNKEPDQTVFMTLSLAGLGQIYRFTRDWGELMGQPHESTSTVAR